ncbi:MAG: hypothetical protein MMC33_003820 [Icmadophila ericetorum]|nr:hypothetical protein [Icmadophila ericetorum]
MHVDWRKPGAHIRLLVAYLAANSGQRIDYQKIATYYGEGATYDAVEGQFRKLRKEAKEMIYEIDSGVRPPAPIRGTPNKRRGGMRRGTSADTDLDDDQPATPPPSPSPKKTKKPRTPRKKKDESPFVDRTVSGRVRKSATPQKANGGSDSFARRIKQENTPEATSSSNTSYSTSSSFDSFTTETSLESDFADNFAATLLYGGNMTWNVPLNQPQIYRPSATIEYWRSADL